jgi:hypothetical protein
MEVNTQTDAVNDQAAQNAEAPSVTDLDALSTFKFQGKEFTPDKLLEIVNGYEKLSESRSEWEKQREFDENLDADLDAVAKNPALAEKFKAVYPPKYHRFLDAALKTSAQSPASPQTAPNALPPEFMQKLQELEAWKKSQEERAHQAEVANATAQIDKITEPLFKKFPLADETAVFAKAEALLQQGSKLTEKTWERLIRENHEGIQKRWDQFQGATIKQQVEKGRRAQDVPPGGATPGQAPVKPRTLAEAEEALMRHVRSQGA